MNDGRTAERGMTCDHPNFGASQGDGLERHCGGQLSKCWYKSKVEGSYPDVGTSLKWRAVIQMLVQAQSGGQLSQCWYKLVLFRQSKMQFTDISMNKVI